MSDFQTTPTMWRFMNDPAYVRVIAGPIGCLAGDTLVVTESGPRRIDALDRPMRVLSWDEKLGQFRFALASASFPKGKDVLYRVQAPHGEWRAAGHHLVLCADGTYQPVESLCHGQSVAQCSGGLTPTTPGFRSMWKQGVHRLRQTAANWLDRCGWLSRRYGQRLLLEEAAGQVFAPSQHGAPIHELALSIAAHTRLNQPSGLLSMRGYAFQVEAQRGDAGYVGFWQGLFSPWRRCNLAVRLSGYATKIRQQWRQLVGQTGSYTNSLTDGIIIAVSRCLTQEVYWDLQVPNTNNYVTVDGTIHHNSGKSVCCCHELMRLAMQQKPNKRGERLSKTLIVRNTFDQLRSTTMATFRSWFPHGEWGLYKASEKTFYVDHQLTDGTRLKAEFAFMPLDTPDDVRKALSLELTFLWANEWREIHPQVADGLLMRLKRYPSMKDGGPTRSCAIFDTNMPDLDTWHFDKMEHPPHNWRIHVQPPAILNLEEYLSQEGSEPEPSEATHDAQGTSWWLNPRADNLNHLDPSYYPDIIPGKSEDFVNVYLRCRYGRSLSGVPVFDKTFNPDFHIADKPFTALKSPDYPLIIGTDLGRTPASTILQRNAWGQLVVLDELTSENMGIETFLDRKLAPLLAKEQYLGCHVVVAPDPAGWAKQQIGEVSPVDIIKQRGFKVARPVTNDPKRRIEAVERVLLRHVDGKPAFVVNPECKELIKGFRYGYRYKVNRTGVQDDKPEKNSSSHVCDSLQYACLVAETGAAGSQLNRGKREVVPASVSSRAWT